MRTSERTISISSLTSANAGLTCANAGWARARRRTAAIDRVTRASKRSSLLVQVPAIVAVLGARSPLDLGPSGTACPHSARNRSKGESLLTPPLRITVPLADQGEEE